MIEVRGLKKTFDGFAALDGADLSVPRGAVYGLVGPNGAGKTTLLRHLTGVYRQDEGSVRFDGEEVWENADVKARIASIPDDWFYFMQAGLRDMMRFYRGFYPNFNLERYEKLKEVFALDETRPLRRMSKGQQKQAAFWLAMCTMPDYLILDEPVDGLDPVMRRQVWSLILQDVAERGTTVLVSSHNLRELEDVCDHVGIMNGGKDFSEWSKKDDLLYKTLRLPVEAVLGRDSVCLADCAIAESKFEKGADVTGRMLSLLPQLNEIRNRGTPDMEFAVSGLLARSQLANGQAMDARRTIEVLRECFAERGLTRFLPNMDAMLCRIDMHTGDLDAADAWYREKAPCEPTHLNVMRRYQYLTQAMVELEDGRPDTAQLTLSPLEPYIQNCARNIDGIHLNVLTAIALHRKKDERWRERLTAALDAAAEYRFIRTVSVYGTAVLPLLEALDWDGDKAWRKRLMAAVRTQAAFYPHFLEPRLAPGEELTPTELQILHLLCADKSNAEIAQIMDVKLPTVKTYVSHILDKLDVKRRAEAKTAAKKLHLVPDNL